MPSRDSDPSLLQARLAGMLAVALDAILTVDFDGLIIDFNPAAEAIFGYTRAEALGRDMTELIVPPALRPHHRAGLARLRAGEAPRLLGRRVEISAMRRDGSELPVELAITRIDLPDASTVFTAHLRDISDRRNTEQRLAALQSQLEQRIHQRTDELATSEASRRESQELFTKSFHGSPALMSIAALPGGEFIEVNDAFIQAVGLTRETVIGHTTLELNLWHDITQREIFIHRISSAMTVRDFEAEFTTATGTQRVLLLNADRIEIQGRPCMLTVAVDITERRRRLEAEAALANVERRYRSLFENAVEGLYLSSVDGRFIEVNPALARMFGYPDSATCIAAVNEIGREIYVDPARRPTFFKLLERGDRVTDFESEVRRADGSHFWVSESVRAVRRPDGSIDHFEGVALDITARRDAALALAEARDAADTANRAKSQFLASMSHELRTPLNGILGYTQILRRDPSLIAGQRHGVDVIHESAEHLLGLINDVLDLSKVEAGRLELHPSSFDLRALLSGVTELLAPRARAQGLAFHPRFSPDLPPRVITDSARLRQVLLNLVANSLKFTAEGSITFSVTCPTYTPDHATVRFAVADSGCGIAPDDLRRLFEPFVQLGHADRHAEGTGLGLVISQRLVTALGGTMAVKSQPGAGSEFAFELVLPVGTETTAPFASTSPVTGYRGPRRRILVVDDHVANLDILRGLLEPLGFLVETATTGEAGLEAAATNLPDLVLMDLRMPGMGGLAAIAALRTHHPTGGLRIIAVSASAFDFDRTEALAHGCDDFLPKPVRAETLFTTIGEVLNLEWEHRTTETPPGTLAPFTGLTQPPPAAEIEAIYDLALSGDVVGLRARAEALLATDSAHHDFAHHVLELTANFKLRALRKLLEPLRPTAGN